MRTRTWSKPDNAACGSSGGVPGRNVGTDRLVHPLSNTGRPGLASGIDRSTSTPATEGAKRIDVEHGLAPTKKAAISYSAATTTTTTKMKRASTTAAATTLLLGLLAACLLVWSATATWVLRGHEDVEVIRRKC